VEKESIIYIFKEKHMTEMETQINKLGLLFTTKHSNLLTTGKFVNCFL